MGASPTHHPRTRTSGRRFATPTALALVVVLVGATSAATRPLAADATSDLTAAAAGPSGQPQASVTDPGRWAGTATASVLPPPVRVAAAGTPLGGRLPADI